MHTDSNEHQLIHNKILTNLLVVCFVAVFIWVGAYVITDSRAEPSKPVENVIVTMSTMGFLPSRVTVQPDTKVIWVNVSATSHVPEIDPLYQSSGAFPAPKSPPKASWIPAPSSP